MRLFVAILVFAASLHAASPSPVRAKRGMVVSVDEHASKAGIAMLRQGGNAVDAAVATAFALAVTHPAAGNLGGGGFMLIRFAAGRTTFIDFRERAPAAAQRNMYLDAAGNVQQELATAGPLASGVPGTVAGLDLARRKYGKLRWSTLVAPAVRLAREGFVVSHELAGSLLQPDVMNRLARFPESKRIFLKNGRYWRTGERLRQPDLARTLERIRLRGAREFYRGDTARRFAAFMKEAGGIISYEDLNNYEAVEREPVRGSYRGHEIVSAPPPSSGGTMLLEMLNVLEGVDLASKGALSADSMHWTVEAMRRAFADRAQFLGDPDFVKVPVRGLIDKKYAATVRASIDPQRATPSANVHAGNPAPFEASDTTHISVVDGQGNAVALTYTLENSYGSGVTVKGLGFLLNNQMGDFATKPGFPNSAGLIQGESNAIAPGKRPLSSMTPTIVTKDGELFLVTGSPGGPTIINTVLNIILAVVDYKLNVQQAVDMPRFHHQWMPDKVRVERVGFSPDTLAILRARGHEFDEREKWGDAHSIMIAPDGTRLGAADPRLSGRAVGF